MAVTQANILTNGAINTTGIAPNVPVVNGNASGSYAFPKTLQNQPFWMSFSFYQYQMPDLVAQNVYYADQGTIRLPFPNVMRDSHHVEYSAESLGLVGAAAVNAAKGAGGGLGGIAAGLGTGAGLGALGSAINGALGGGIAGQLVTGAQNVVGGVLQTAGLALNPFLSVMFKSPAFKQHQLSWKLAPTSQDESITLNSIINTFRGNMLPNLSNALGGTLLQYPNICQITISVNSDTYFTYAFKPAVIQNLDINWTGAGQPSFFGETKAPTEVEITLQLMEIEYWLGSDYGINPTNPVIQAIQQTAQTATQNLTTQPNSGQNYGTGVNFGDPVPSTQ